MSQEQHSPETPAPEAEKKALLATQHNAAVPKDDPMLMFVTICNAFLGEVQALHQRYESGLTKLMAASRNFPALWNG